MKLFLSIVAVSMSAPTIDAISGTRATTGLRRKLDSTFVAPNGQESSSNEICLSTGDASLSKAKTAVLQSLAKRVGSGSKPGAGTHIVPPKYVFGCFWGDIDCYICDLCEDIYGLLLETGSAPACDATCAVTAEAAGGGPEDPVADAVALDCGALCEAIFSAAGDGTAFGACSFADLC